MSDRSWGPGNPVWEDLEEERLEDLAYESAKCKTQHKDGSPCRPTWDGFVYICLESLN